MKEPKWLSRQIILAVHGQSLARFGGGQGLRDEDLMESALARPNQMLAYGQPGIFDLAAAYAHGLVKNHPFIDGNKRIGFMAAYTFLGLNGFRLNAPEEEAVVYTLALAAGELDAEAYSKWLERSCSPVDPPLKD